MYGDKNFFGIYRGLGKFLARHGVVGVLINYRLSPFVRHPAHVRDVARAFAWVVRNIARYGGDPQRIVLGGHSAGGHLVSLLATDPQYLGDPDLKLTPCERAAIRGVASVSGVYRIPGPDEFRVMARQIVRSLAERGQGAIPALMVPVLLKVGESINPFNLVFGTDRTVQKTASPIEHVHAGLPPFQVLTAELEVHGLRAMADDFATALRRAGCSVERAELDDCNHRTIVLAIQKDGQPGAKALLDFVDRCAAIRPDRSKLP
jgi:acetyl esterase/lipase